MSLLQNKVKEDNNLDKATIISMFPFAIREVKPSIQPGYYYIPAAEETKFQLLTINPAYEIYRIPATEQILKQEIKATEVARSIVQDFLKNVLASGENCYPGLFWARGVFTKEQVQITFKEELKEAYQAQLNWYQAIVKIADDDWASYRKHIFINENQRHAAKILGYKRDWLMDTPQADNHMLVNCPACFSLIHPQASICGNCRTIVNVEKYNSLSSAAKEVVGAK